MASRWRASCAKCRRRTSCRFRRRAARACWIALACWRRRRHRRGRGDDDARSRSRSVTKNEAGCRRPTRSRAGPHRAERVSVGRGDEHPQRRQRRDGRSEGAARDAGAGRSRAGDVRDHAVESGVPFADHAQGRSEGRARSRSSTSSSPIRRTATLPRLREERNEAIALALLLVACAAGARRRRSGPRRTTAA